MGVAWKCGEILIKNVVLLALHGGWVLGNGALKRLRKNVNEIKCKGKLPLLKCIGVYSKSKLN